MDRTGKQAGVLGKGGPVPMKRSAFETATSGESGSAEARDTLGARELGAHGRAKASSHFDWRRRMSDHIAYALLVYTALQIFVTIGALKAGGESLLPYLALVILVVAIIPACRRFEARWNRLTDEQAHDPALAPHYRRDLAWLWMLAIGLPFALTGLFKGLGLVLS